MHYCNSIYLRSCMHCNISLAWKFLNQKNTQVAVSDNCLFLSSYVQETSKQCLVINFHIYLAVCYQDPRHSQFLRHSSFPIPYDMTCIRYMLEYYWEHTKQSMHIFLLYRSEVLKQQLAYTEQLKHACHIYTYTYIWVLFQKTNNGKIGCFSKHLLLPLLCD